MMIKIGLIGDYSPHVTAHVAIPKALKLAAIEAECEVAETWLATEAILEKKAQLFEFDALWCVPASPYKSMDGALSAIRFAREKGVPFLGTCGGFQHAVIEYVRNVLGFAKADHAESNPDAEMPIMSPLSCSLIEKTGQITLQENTRVARIFGASEIAERYHCNFGFNDQYRFLFKTGEMRITGADINGEPRVVEVESHPFFIATQFQPERSALAGKTHPLVSAYLEAAKSFQSQARQSPTKDENRRAEV